MLSDGKKSSAIRFLLVFCAFLLALDIVWVLILATVIIHDNQPEFIPLLIGLSLGGVIDTFIAGFFKYKQKKYEPEETEASDIQGE